LEAKAASKLKIGDPVPALAATVTQVFLNISATALDRHARVVADIQDDVPQLLRSALPPRSSPNVAVCSPRPKLSPDTVREAYPLGGAFSRASEITAVSKLKTGLPVPDTAATVNECNAKISVKSFDRQATVVADVHDDVKHRRLGSSPKVAVLSDTPKSRPATVRDE